MENTDDKRGKNCKENHNYNLKFNLMLNFKKHFKIKYKFWNIELAQNFSRKKIKMKRRRKWNTKVLKNRGIIQKV